MGTGGAVVHEDGRDGGRDEGDDVVEEQPVLHRPGDVQRLARLLQDVGSVEEAASLSAKSRYFKAWGLFGCAPLDG